MRVLAERHDTAKSPKCVSKWQLVWLKVQKSSSTVIWAMLGGCTDVKANAQLNEHQERQLIGSILGNRSIHFENYANASLK